MFKDLGIVAGFVTPALLLVGPILLAAGIYHNHRGTIAGGVCLGVGLVCWYWRGRR